MEPDWYDAWAKRYCVSFGVNNPEWIATFLSWREAIIGLGGNATDLTAVTKLCLMDDPGPQFPTEHLRAIKRHLGAIKGDRRNREAQAAQASESTYGICTYCGSHGLIAGMPYPADVRGGEWHPHRRNHEGEPIYRTCAVYCSCPMGKRMHGEACASEFAERVGKPLGLADYEKRIDPAWREHIAERELAERALVRAHSSADAASRGFTAGIGTPVGGGR